MITFSQKAFDDLLKARLKHAIFPRKDYDAIPQIGDELLIQEERDSQNKLTCLVHSIGVFNCNTRIIGLTKASPYIEGDN